MKQLKRLETFSNNFDGNWNIPSYLILVLETMRLFVGYAVFQSISVLFDGAIKLQ